MISKNKLEFIVPDKYFKNSTEDLIIGLIRYLREQGKTCKFLGFNEHPNKLLGFTVWQNNYVVLIDGIKYYGDIGGSIDTNYYANFFIVNDEEHDYIENRLNKRVSQILESLEDGK
ncbi:MAG: hypothetical protein K0S01_1000 [Herbinix sp.]|jgi:hypothetical protein|nr:hypothetical protein [Herbinix sp.]